MTTSSERKAIRRIGTGKRLGRLATATGSPAGDRQKQGERSRHVRLDCAKVSPRGEKVVTRAAPLVVPTMSIRHPRAEREKGGWRARWLVDMACGLKPIRTAVVHPVDTASLVGAVEAASAKLIVPTLVGPEVKIRAAAEQARLDLSPYELVSTEHSHAAAAEAVRMVRAGKVDALMKGALHTDELMSAVVDPNRGLRTARRMSHVFAIEVPSYPRPLFVTDAAINISPSLGDKHDIVQNAIDLVQSLGICRPKVAILSAVETVTETIRSTLDAAALCKMAERGQITGAVIDGPLAFDNAISVEAAQMKGIVSPVAGKADILVVPDLEAGNMLVKQLEYLAGAQIAGIVLGARVPVILTSRADKTAARLNSCAIALLLYRHGEERQPWAPPFSIPKAGNRGVKCASPRRR